MKEFLIQVLKKESVSGNQVELKECMKLFARRAKEKGLEVKWNEEPLFLVVGRDDLKNPDVGILCHLDVVPPYFPPRIEGDRIYGRGAIDMKGPTVACFEGMLQSDHPSVAMAFTADEETSAEGAIYLSTRFSPKKVLIVPDQNRDFNITKEAKGLVFATVNISGEAGHGSTPWVGENALEKAYDFFEELKVRLRVDNGKGWNNTLNLAKVGTENEANNVIPDHAYLRLDFRFKDENFDYWKEKFMETSEDFGVEITDIGGGDRIKVDITEDLEVFMDTVQKVTDEKPVLRKNNSTCDARYFANKVPTLIITKCAGGKSHARDEYVDFSALQDMKDVTRRYLENLREKKLI